MSPGATTLPLRRQSAHQRSFKQSDVFEPVALAAPLLMANFVHGDAGIAARLPLGAMRSFRFCRATAQAGAHKLLAGVTGHAARLRVAVLHSLLL
jgi:hypothetical protein